MRVIWKFLMLMALVSLITTSDITTQQPDETEKKLLEKLKEQEQKVYQEAYNNLQKVLSVIKERKEEEQKKAKEIRQKLEKVKFTIDIKGGESIRDANLIGYTKDDITLRFGAEGGQLELTLDWEWLTDKSAYKILSAMKKFEGAKGHYELGKFCAERGMWKEAKKEFDEAIKKEPTYKNKIPDLSKIIEGKTGFAGSAKKLGRNGFHISYDFTSPEQTQDFESPAKKGSIKIEKEKMFISSDKEPDIWFLRHFNCDKYAELEATISISSKQTSFAVPLFWGNNQGYVFILNGDEKGQHYLRKVTDGGKKQEDLQVSSKKPLVVNKPAKIKVIARKKELKLYIGEGEAEPEEVIKVTDSTFENGGVGFGCQNGKVEFSSLVFLGATDPRKIVEVFSEYEKVIEKLFYQEEEHVIKTPPKKPTLDNSAEHDYFKYKIQNKNVAAWRKYLNKKVDAKGIFRGDATVNDVKKWCKSLEEVIKEYPEFPAAYYVAGFLYKALHDNVPAMRALENAVKYYPNFYEAHTLLADVYKDLHIDEKAFEVAKKALELKPDMDDIYVIRGILYFKQGNIEKALEDLEIALTINPANQEALFYKKRIRLWVQGPQLAKAIKKKLTYHDFVTDVGKKKAELFAQNLTAAFEYYMNYFKVGKVEQRNPRVIVFNNRDSFFTYGRATQGGMHENVLGFYTPEFNELMFFDDVDTDETLEVMYHEAFHHFADRYLRVELPYWINEGTAEYFGSIKIKDGKVVETARIVEMRFPTAVWMVQMNEWTRFKDIMTQTPAEFYGPRIGLNYAQAWAMVHFFFEYKDGGKYKYRDILLDYINLFKEPITLQEAYDKTFGKIDITVAEKEWMEWIKSVAKERGQKK